MMKDFVVGVLVTLALIILFSATSFPDEIFPPLGNIGTQYPGESGMVLPGGGDGQAEALTRSETHGSTEPAEPGEVYEVAYESEESSEVHEPGEPGEVYEPEEENQTESEEEEDKNMNDILLAFWHGVATVLIGETVALMVAIAWMKIKGGE